MNGFFTPKSFTTLAGSTACVLLIVNVIQHATGWAERWFSLIVAVVVAVVGLVVTIEYMNRKARDYIFAVLNGFLIYATAFGVQNIAIAEPPPTEMATVNKTIIVERPVFEMREVPGLLGTKTERVRRIVRESRVQSVRVEIPKTDQPRNFRSPW